jgi:purine-nucleoside phosphorylase
MTLEEAIAASAATLRARGPLPQLGVLLGSGWGPVSDLVQGAVDVPYGELPAFPELHIGGHSGQVRLGQIGGKNVAVLAGRKHTYETGEADGMKGAIRTLAALGVTTLIQTNAAGSMDPAMRPGELMLLADHLNIAQRTPLLYESGDKRFIDMSRAYDPGLRELAKEVAAQTQITLHEGVYAWWLGPQFETPAEIRMLRSFGASAVGMSTVPETILARHAGLKVLAISMLTNMAAGMDAQTLSHAHTLATAKSGSANAVKLMQALLAALEP